MKTCSTLTTLIIKLKNDAYPIYFIGSGVEAFQRLLKSELEKHPCAFLVTDTTVENTLGARCLPENVFQARFVGHPGEKLKSLNTLETLYDALSNSSIDRQSALVAFGGGVVGDLTGFSAATYLRGIAYYQVPTSLLAMVDSAIGGKTGINLSAGKNLVGAFYHPKAVFICPTFLQSLSTRDFSSGMAEVIKYGLIADFELLTELSQGEPLHPKHPKLLEIIYRCCAIKAKIVIEDAEETKGSRSLLNLGHTFGHALETVAGYGEYLHGEAVSIGLCLAMKLSEMLGYENSQILSILKDILKKYKLPTQLRSPLNTSDLLAAMMLDKKTKKGISQFIVLEKAGQATIKENIPTEWIKVLWEAVGARPL